MCCCWFFSLGLNVKNQRRVGNVNTTEYSLPANKTLTAGALVTAISPHSKIDQSINSLPDFLSLKKASILLKVVVAILFSASLVKNA